MTHLLTVATTAGDFAELVKWFGVPGALFAVMIFAMVRGWIVTGREALQRERDHAERIADYENRLERMREEKNFWRDLAMQTQQQLETATRGLEKAVEKMPRSKRAGPPPDGGD